MELRELCLDESVAAERLGAAAAEELKNRLADVRAADSMDVVLMLAGRPQIGTYLNRDCVSFDLAGSFKLVVVQNHAPPRNDAGGGTAWSRVKRVRVLALESK